MPDVKEALRTQGIQDEEGKNVTIMISTAGQGSTLLDSVLSEFVVLVPLSTKQERDKAKEELKKRLDKARNAEKTIRMAVQSTHSEISVDMAMTMEFGDLGGMTITVAGGDIDIWNTGVGQWDDQTIDHPRDSLLRCGTLTKMSNGHRVPECKVATVDWSELSMPSNTKGALNLLTRLVSSDGTGNLLGQMMGEMAAVSEKNFF